MGVVKLSTAGILDYSKTSNFLSGNAPVSFGAFDLLETTTLTSSAASVTFSGLGAYSDYKHLQIRAVASTNGGGADSMWAQINGDTGANYSWHYLLANGSTVSSSGLAGQVRMLQGINNNNFGAAVIDVLDFSSVSKNTTFRSLAGNTESPRIVLFSGMWNSTAAVTSINLFNTSSSFGTGSRFSLYGVK